MPSTPSHSSSTHPVELSVMLTALIAATYAFGVYLFSTLLPDMRVALSLNYTEIGWITAVAQVGFLMGALFSTWLVQVMGSVRLIWASALACCVSLGLMPLAGSAISVAGLLVVTGCAAATVWVPMVAVVKLAIPTRHQGKVLGLISSGTAYGLFFSGLCTPVLLSYSGWQSVWIGAAVVTLALSAWGLLRLRILASATQASSGNGGPEHGSAKIVDLAKDRAAITVVLLMLLGGLACMPVMNYLVAYLREELGHSADTAGQIWSTIGFVGMFGGFAMGALADKITVKKALVLTYVFLVISTLLFLYHASYWGLVIGAALFGLAFNAIFGLVPAYISLYFEANKATAVFAACNVALGLGSMAGNLIAGSLREVQQSFIPVFIASFSVNMLLVLLCAFLPRVNRQQNHNRTA